ncbi:MAG: glycosyltransferase family 2 protein [Clostridiales bacterium]|jgi:GT2 family glycosyltransferase|nr:glycosyltransferase family 2 protein [Clostridiales bacterium]
MDNDSPVGGDVTSGDSNEFTMQNIKSVIAEKDESISRLSSELASLQEKCNYYVCELDYYKSNYEYSIKQQEELRTQLSEAQTMCAQIGSSTVWRATKPLRVVLGLLRGVLVKFRVTYALAKGVKSLLRFGPKTTIMRAKNYLGNYMGMRAKRKQKIKKAELQRQRLEVFDRDIKISIITPLYNTDETMLAEMIESVMAQTYSNWELCLADGSDDEHLYVGQTVQKYLKMDKRVLYKKLDKNLGISENSNAAIEMATGEYFGLLDHDDLLHPSALYYVMQAICDKNAEFVYTDEGVFKKRPSDMHLIHYKPDFALNNLRGNNYICHFSVFSRKLLEKAGGGFRQDFDGSQDHDLFLRLVEQTKEVAHVPVLLYYWRSHENSVASGAASKPYVMSAGLKAVQAHLDRTGVRGTVHVSSSPDLPTFYRIRYDLVEQPLVSIIIPNKDNVEVLKHCVNSIIFKSTYRNIEILIIENNSTGNDIFEYYKYLENKEKIKIFAYTGVFDFSKINNWAVSLANGKYMLFLNNDTEVISENWIEEMLMFSQQPTVGAVGCMLYYPNNTVQHAGVVMGVGGVASVTHSRYPRGHGGYMGRMLYAQNLSAVTGACMMVRKDVFESVSGFEEGFAVAFNDVDLCMKIRKAQYDIVWTPFAELYHHESLTRGYENTPKKQERFLRETALFKKRWAKELAGGDPYYNPNFDLAKGVFQL